MRELFATGIGILAAALTSLSYVPQAIKAASPGSTGDLSLRMLCALISGLALWIGYGVLKADGVIVLANSVGASLVGFGLYCKMRDMRHDRKR